MHSTDLEKAKEIINSIDLSFVVDRLVKIEKWKKHEAKQGVQQYRNYLFLLKKYAGHILPPSQDIDEVWHAHILHTKQYREFCKQAFQDRENKFLDHDPQMDHVGSMPLTTLKQYFNNTQFLYYQEVGEYIHQIRGLSFLRKAWDKMGDFLLRDEKSSAIMG